MASSLKTRSPVWFFVMLAVTVYVLTLAGIAISTQDKCGGMQADKTWEVFPPGWHCVPSQLPGRF